MKKGIIFLLMSFLLIEGYSKKKNTEKYGLDLYKNIFHFTGGISKRPVPETRLLKDSVNNRIASMCIASSSFDELKKLNIQGLKKRLDLLEKGHVLNSVGSQYELSFPVIVGRKRKALADIVNNAAEELNPIVETMISALRERLGSRQDMLFHILWSRVIDEIWYKAWKIAFPEEELPDCRWVIYPEHIYSVGTNYYSLPGQSDIALTWSRSCTEYLDFFSRFSFEIHQAAWKKEIKDSKIKKKLRKATGKLLPFNISEAWRTARSE